MVKGVRKRLTGTLYYPHYTFDDHSKSMVHYWRPSSPPLRYERETRATYDELRDLLSAGRSKEAEDLRTRTGIMGEAEIVARFDSIQPCKSMPIDLMHLLFENIAPLMIDIWMGDIDSAEEHNYLSNRRKMKLVDSTLVRSGAGIDSSIRRPRSRRVRKLWKADEWRTFVITTSLVALHNVLPEHIVDGWSLFVRVCDIAMRPKLSESELVELESCCLSFYKHFADVYYGGRQEKLHLMRFTMHLLLHIPLSMSSCGPLVCLSLYTIERYIGLIKGETKEKYRYAASVGKRWVFQQSLLMCELRSGLHLPLYEDDDENLKDQRSIANDCGRYEGFYLRGPRKTTSVSRVSDQYGIDFGGRLARFYEEDLQISRNAARLVVQKHSELTEWDRLFVMASDEWTVRRYSAFKNNAERRSDSFIAAEFGSQDGQIDVYYGRLSCFFEHRYRSPLTQRLDSRILVMAAWISREFTVCRQQQLYVRGRSASPQMFSVNTVEDVGCIARYVAAIETHMNGTWRTYISDAMCAKENLISRAGNEEGVRKKLKGVKSHRRR